jgi:hypothetical protein
MRLDWNQNKFQNWLRHQPILELDQKKWILVEFWSESTVIRPEKVGQGKLLCLRKRPRNESLLPNTPGTSST